MRRSVALARLRPLEPELRRQGLSALFLFGSVARDEAAEASDIDLVFEVPPDARFSLFDQARIRNELAEAVDAGVDLVPMDALKPHVRARVAAEMVRVF
jgi:predicted nucleotidyltransferase